LHQNLTKIYNNKFTELATTEGQTAGGVEFRSAIRFIRDFGEEVTAQQHRQFPAGPEHCHKGKGVPDKNEEENHPEGFS
jgi:hypothetical protein